MTSQFSFRQKENWKCTKSSFSFSVHFSLQRVNYCRPNNCDRGLCLRRTLGLGCSAPWLHHRLDGTEPSSLQSCSWYLLWQMTLMLLWKLLSPLLLLPLLPQNPAMCSVHIWLLLTWYSSHKGYTDHHAVNCFWCHQQVQMHQSTSCPFEMFLPLAIIAVSGICVLQIDVQALPSPWDWVLRLEIGCCPNFQ